jgi:hypothetical protein
MAHPVKLAAGDSVKRRRISDTIPKVDGEQALPRVRLNAPITFLQPAETSGVAIDATHTSLRVVVDGPLEPGQRCVAIVQLSNGEETHERMQVLWSRRSTQGWVATLEFA